MFLNIKIVQIALKFLIDGAASSLAITLAIIYLSLWPTILVVIFVAVFLAYSLGQTLNKAYAEFDTVIVSRLEPIRAETILKYDNTLPLELIEVYLKKFAQDGLALQNADGSYSLRYSARSLRDAYCKNLDMLVMIYNMTQEGKTSEDIASYLKVNL